eukprot:7171575-Pyramimonas_sp.AAC.1
MFQMREKPARAISAELAAARAAPQGGAGAPPPPAARAPMQTRRAIARKALGPDEPEGARTNKKRK